MTTPDAPTKAGLRQWLGLAVLAIPTMLAMLDINVLFLALPQLSESLGASATEQLWISDIYGFVIAGFLVTMGTLGDRYGHRKVLMAGGAVFAVASLVAAFAANPETLIAARVVLGIAGATIMPSTIALIMGMFPDPREMGIGLAVWSTAMMAGVALGPVIGGILLDAFWWGSVFLIAVPVMVLLLVAGRATLPAGQPSGEGRLDATSVGLSLLAILPVIYGLKELARTGASTLAIVAVLVGLAAGIVFVRRQKRLESPLLNVGLFAIKIVAGALVVGLLVGAVQGGGGFLIAQHLQTVDGLSPLAAGLWLLIPAAILVAGINVTPKITRYVRPAYVIAGGMVIAAIGAVVLSQVSAEGGLATLVIGNSIVFLGVSPVGMLVAQLVVGSVPPQHMGSAGSLQATGGELGVAVGIAAFGTIGTTVYRSLVEVPAGVAGDAAATARDSISGAVATAEGLPATVAQPLLASARAAFNSGLTTAATVSIGLFLVLAAVAVATLRGAPATGAGDGHGAPEETPEAETASDAEETPAGQDDELVTSGRPRPPSE